MAISETEIENERFHRYSLFEQLKAKNPELIFQAGLLRDNGIKGGAAGVWRDLARTQDLIPGGIAVSVQHTGRSYDDDLSDSFLLYHYPKTLRAPSQDSGEIASLMNAANLRMPIFVIIDIGNLRRLELGYIVDFDDESACCLISFSENNPEPRVLKDELPTDESPFATSERKKKVSTSSERDPDFKFKVMKRYGGKCLLTGIDVHEMLDAAHVVEVKHKGSDVPSNGLLLEKGVHAAFDAQLWGIRPGSLELVVRRNGPTLPEMGVRVIDLQGSRTLPHPKAIEYRWEKFVKLANPDN